MFLGSPASAQVRQFDVPAEDAGRSIPELARQAGIQVVAPGAQLHGVTTPEIKGTFDVIVALNLMLKGTGLVVSRSAEGIVTISPPETNGYEEREGMLKEQKTAVSVLALLVTGALSGGPAYAQEGGSVETVVVTGQRAALESAVQLKAKAEEIIDSVSAEDVGKLPDNSVTEVLQRVPGVNITRIQTGGNSEDYVGEGTGITIRGLDSVVSQLNGRDAFSSANGRGLAWEDIPPELAQGVDVYKSLSASMPEGGFGGVINLRTRQPFDFDGLTINASVNGNYADYAAAARFGGVALVSDRWQTKIGEMGLLLNVAYSDLKTKADGVQVNPYVPVVWSPNYPMSQNLPWVSSYNLTTDSPNPQACSGNTSFTCQEVYVPQAINYTQRNDDRQRTGLYAAFQWNPSEKLSLFATAFRSRYNENTLSRSITNTVSGYVALDPSSSNTFDKNGNLLSSTGITSFQYQDPGASAYFGVNSGWAYQNIPYQFDSNLSHQVNQTSDFSVGGEWDPNDAVAIKFAGQHVESFAKNNGKWADLYAFVPGYGVTLSPYGSSAAPVMTFPDIDLTNKNRFGWNSTMDHNTHNAGQENAIYMDGSWKISERNFIRAIKFGVKVTDRTENDWETPYNWKALTPSYQSGWVVVDGAGNPVLDSSGNVQECFTASATCASKNAASVNAVKTAGNTASSFSSLVDTGSWFNGKAGLPAQAWFPSLSMLQQDFSTIHSYSKGLGAPGDTTTAIDYTPDDQSRLKETMFAAYAQANYAYDGWRMPISGNIGVRVVAYKDKASGAFVNPYYTSPISLQPVSNYDNCAAVNGVYPASCITHGGSVPNVVQFTVAKSYVMNSGSHSEVDALPSMNMQILPMPEMLPGLKLRLAASQGISRPSFQQLNPKGSMSGSYVGTYQAYFNGTMGNPNLKPEKAEQFDGSIEYYFDHGGMAHFSPFYKQIHNYIADGTSQVPTTLNAVVTGGTTSQSAMGCVTPISIGETCQQTIMATVIQPVNEKKAAIVRGFEVGLQKYLDFVPDPFNSFGFDVNYTYISSSQPGALSYDMKGNQISGLPMVGLSKNTVNAAIMYDRQPISIRLAYNWRDDFLVTTAAYQTTNTYNYALNQGVTSLGVMQGTVVHYSLPVFQYPMGTLDANLTLTLTDNVEWTFQASNLTKTVARLYMGVGDHRENRSWYTADTRYTSQLRVKF
jgi:TonB-dependent receptor